MSFAYPWFLALVPAFILLIGVLIRAARKRRHDLKCFAAPEVLPEVIDFSGERLRSFQLILRLGCLAMLFLALLGPEWGFHWRETGKGPDVIFAIDTSKSMLATDIQPNRLERCKLAITALLPEIQGSKAGLIAFAGSSFLQCPLIDDFGIFKTILASLTVQSIPRGGTAIGTAIRIGRRSFATGSSGRKVLIIMTDGENHEGDPLREAGLAAREGIRIYTIGIGSPDGVTIPITGPGGTAAFLKDKEGKVVKTKLNEKSLKAIAAAGGGKYVHNPDIDLGLKKLYRTEMVAERSKASDKWLREPVNHFQLPLILAIVLLGLELAAGLKRPAFQERP